RRWRRAWRHSRPRWPTPRTPRTPPWHSVSPASNRTWIRARDWPYAAARRAAKLCGMEILRPGDPGYDPARRIWNGMIDRCPRLIARCASTADVVAAVRMARDQGLEIGVRCGGHSIAGHAVPDDG